MKFKYYINESNKKLENEINNWLKLNPDKILFNGKDITRWKFPSDILMDMIKGDQDIISIMKDTLNGWVGIQIYKDKNKLKVDNIKSRRL